MRGGDNPVAQDEKYEKKEKKRTTLSSSGEKKRRGGMGGEPKLRYETTRQGKEKKLLGGKMKKIRGRKKGGVTVTPARDAFRKLKRKSSL